MGSLNNRISNPLGAVHYCAGGILFAYNIYSFILSPDDRRAAGGVKDRVNVKEKLIEKLPVIGHRIAAYLDTRHERIVLVQLVIYPAVHGAVDIKARIQYALQRRLLHTVAEGRDKQPRLANAGYNVLHPFIYIVINLIDRAARTVEIIDAVMRIAVACKVPAALPAFHGGIEGFQVDCNVGALFHLLSLLSL